MPELQLATFFAIFLKAGGFIVFAPIVNELKVPVMVKTLLALCYAIILYPETPDLIELDLLEVIKGVTFGCLLGLCARLPIFILHMAISAFGQSYNLSQYLNTSQDIAAGVLGEIYKWCVCGVLASSGAIWVGLVGLQMSPNTDLKSIFDFIDWLTEVSLQVVAPFLLFSVIFNLISGFVNRAMPQLMVMLVFAPLSVFLAVLFNMEFLKPIVVVWVDGLLKLFEV
ncbi:flagellar biosynthetic protein FliR [Donghicola sp. C2-DW-16]|uniref:Flagellar biosynthetic protein FliR n=1 Tax=Donghicola mangrovi TaxID=2729614 RepID=A0ABX2P953_9RHOB|nr:flagellar biosynthetic protein FliR [Donghicola mangrovi]NVO25973.1 flagellar biosynthetic protein FliR [Donghicola mangrovi]